MHMIGNVMLLAVTIVLLIDLLPILFTWVRRVKIGRHRDISIWSELIVQKGVKWLNKTPKIKVTDNKRMVIIDILRKNYTKRAIQDWQEASLLLGLIENFKRNHNDNLKNEISKFLGSKINSQGNWKKKPKNIDATILAYAIMKIDFIDFNEKPVADFIWNLIKEHIGDDGTVEYRKHMKNYRYVDTIGFICPFLILYGKKYNKKECMELAIDQIEQYKIYGLMKDYNIPCHAYTIDNKIPVGIYGWGRGAGWYAIGIMDSWNELESGSPYKDILEKYIIDFAESMIKFQNSNGSWNWVLTRSETIPDSSVTSVISWFMLKASKIDSISEKCTESYNKSIKYLMSVTRKDGIIDFSQGDTKDIGVYSLIFDELPFTQGFGIRSINANESRGLGDKKNINCNKNSNK